jgi:ADP-ribose pyrophosphatase YjhB (NUDIX family)
VANHPTLNYCPQCGATLCDREIYGRTRRYCRDCDRVIFRDPKVAAGTIVEQEGKILLVRRGLGPGQGLWSIPAGFVEYDEAPSVTAVRECLEETGLEVAVAALLDIISGTINSGEASFLIVYSGTVMGGVLQAGDDADNASFFSPEALPPLAFDSTKEALKRWKERRELRCKEKKYGHD